MPRPRKDEKKIYTPCALEPDERAYVEGIAEQDGGSLSNAVRLCVRFAMTSGTLIRGTTISVNNPEAA